MSLPVFDPLQLDLLLMVLHLLSDRNRRSLLRAIFRLPPATSHAAGCACFDWQKELGRRYRESAPGILSLLERRAAAASAELAAIDARVAAVGDISTQVRSTNGVHYERCTQQHVGDFCHWGRPKILVTLLTAWTEVPRAGCSIIRISSTCTKEISFVAEVEIMCDLRIQAKRVPGRAARVWLRISCGKHDVCAQLVFITHVLCWIDCIAQRREAMQWTAQIVDHAVSILEVQPNFFFELSYTYIYLGNWF